MINKEKLLEELEYIKESGSYGVMFLDLSDLIYAIKRGKYDE